MLPPGVTQQIRRSEQRRNAISPFDRDDPDAHPAALAAANRMTRPAPVASNLTS
jgi:hypothetical protein